MITDTVYDIDGLVQERRNSSALAMEFRLSCTNPSICEDNVIILLQRNTLVGTWQTTMTKIVVML